MKCRGCRRALGRERLSVDVFPNPTKVAREVNRMLRAPPLHEAPAVKHGPYCRRCAEATGAGARASTPEEAAEFLSPEGPAGGLTVDMLKKAKRYLVERQARPR